MAHSHTTKSCCYNHKHRGPSLLVQFRQTMLSWLVVDGCRLPCEKGFTYYIFLFPFSINTIKECYTYKMLSYVGQCQIWSIRSTIDDSHI